MNCQQFWNTLPQRGGEITEEHSSHLAACSACAGQWEPQKALHAGLHSLLEDWRQTEAPARVEAGLTAAFRVNSGSKVRHPVRHSWFPPVFAWASAAAAMVAIALVLMHGWHPTSARPDHFAAPHRLTQNMPVVASVADSDSDDESSVLDEGFVRLPNAARLEPTEAYDFVTVAFPGSYMIALGLPLSEDRASDTVLAKVALGADGTARALRLVADGETF
jgi:hypothetical protein